ncbi:MAG: hypothetical protein ACLR0P_07755 [Oscillospiraceae bacterium]
MCSTSTAAARAQAAMSRVTLQSRSPAGITSERSSTELRLRRRQRRRYGHGQPENRDHRRYSKLCLRQRRLSRSDQQPGYLDDRRRTGYVSGGGGKADNSSGGDVTGDTSITVANSAVVKNTVYGGGNLTAVSGKATVNFNVPNGTGK